MSQDSGTCQRPGVTGQWYLPKAWCHRTVVPAKGLMSQDSGTCQRPGVTGSVLGPVSVRCEIGSLLCDFYLSVEAPTVVSAGPSLRYTEHVGRTFSSQHSNNSRPALARKAARFVSQLVDLRPSKMLQYLGVESAQTRARAATLT